MSRPLLCRSVSYGREIPGLPAPCSTPSARNSTRCWQTQAILGPVCAPARIRRHRPGDRGRSPGRRGFSYGTSLTATSRVCMGRGVVGGSAGRGRLGVSALGRPRPRSQVSGGRRLHRQRRQPPVPRGRCGACPRLAPWQCAASPAPLRSTGRSAPAPSRRRLGRRRLARSRSPGGRGMRALWSTEWCSGSVGQRVSPRVPVTTGHEATGSSVESWLSRPLMPRRPVAPAVQHFAGR